VRRGHGSARDALSALAQVAAAGGAVDERPTVARVTETLDDPDPSALLVAVAELHEAGWSSQELVAELIDELRQSFLLALSPSVAEVAGSDRDRLAAVAGRLGLAKLVRGMELLGRAGVDMREAPDPRVVLEVTLVRLTRPELDETPEALLERLSRLEQAVRELAEGTAPSLPASPRTPEAPPLPTAPTERPAPSRQRGRPEAAATQEKAPAAPAPPSAPEAGGTAVDRDTLVQAWGDHVLRSLPPKAKALCSAGRFVAVTQGVAEFALPKAAHRDRCEEVRPIVEEALSRYFKTSVPLRFVVESGAEGLGPVKAAPPAPPSRRAGAPPPADQETPPVDDGGDLEDFDAAGVASESEIESVAQARVFDAFPGAEEVRE
jgi:DNA polymerase-3 subunit gamma/tau